MPERFVNVIITALLSVVLVSSTAAARGRAGGDTISRVDVRPSWNSESGTASYYGAAHQGRLSASGILFDQLALTAAHPWLPFGTKVKVILAGTDRSVVVTITDRLHSETRIVDLSLAAARELGMVRRGIARVTLSPA